jgi:hypothetical protein
MIFRTPDIKRYSLIAMAAALVAGLVGCAAPDSRAGAGGKANAATLRLFNGKDLSNFYTYLEKHRYDDPLGVFSVVEKDGAPAIRVSGEQFGGFITRAEYENYRLVIEFKWGTRTWGQRLNKAMDSGILLHCTGPDGNYAGYWMASVECQIIQGGCGDLLVLKGKDAAGQPIRSALTVECEQSGAECWYHPGAAPITHTEGRFNWYGRDRQWRDVQGFRGQHDVESPAGKWTRMEVICDGGNITNLVNGHVVNVGTGSHLRKGKLLFQSEGAEIFYRRIELTPLRSIQ